MADTTRFEHLLEEPEGLYLPEEIESADAAGLKESGITGARYEGVEEPVEPQTAEVGDWDDFASEADEAREKHGAPRERRIRAAFTEDEHK